MMYLLLLVSIIILPWFLVYDMPHVGNINYITPIFSIILISLIPIYNRLYQIIDLKKGWVRNIGLLILHITIIPTIVITIIYTIGSIIVGGMIGMQDHTAIFAIISLVVFIAFFIYYLLTPMQPNRMNNRNQKLSLINLFIFFLAIGIFWMSFLSDRFYYSLFTYSFHPIIVISISLFCIADSYYKLNPIIQKRKLWFLRIITDSFYIFTVIVILGFLIFFITQNVIVWVQTPNIAINHDRYTDFIRRELYMSFVAFIAILLFISLLPRYKTKNLL